MSKARNLARLIVDSGGDVDSSALNAVPFITGRNRIINGDMRIDQRNAGASVTPSNETVTYITDRFYFIRSSSTSPTLQRSTDAPTGFTNSLLFTNASTGATPTYAQVVQNIEGFNAADLGWGAAGAATVTVSFWVKSSLTGTYSVAIRNSAANRSYVDTYTINAANTWEQKTVTIPGDTSGTWLKDNGIGISLVYRFGGSGGTTNTDQWTATGDVFASGSVNVMGTSNATWQITGVQLEAGSVATPFERRPYGTELQLAQRYYYRTADDGSTTNLMAVGVESSSSAAGGFPHPVSMRAAPTITLGSGIRFFSAATSTITPSISGNRSSTTTFAASFAISGATGGQAGSIFKGAANGFVEASSVL